MNDHRSKDRLENLISWVIVGGALFYFGTRIAEAILTRRLPWLP